MKYHRKTSAADSNNPDKGNERLASIVDNIIGQNLTTLVIEATSRCNLACSYCGMHSKTVFLKDRELNQKGEKFLKTPKHMELKTFKEIIKKCAGLKKLKILYLHGDGEPLLHPDIIKMVKIAKKADVAEQIIIVTNGVLLDKNMFRNLIKTGVTTIRVSLDIISPDKFRQIKGADFGGKVLINVDACVDLIRDEKLPVKFIILCASPDSKDDDLKEETKKIISHFEKKIQNIKSVEIQQRKIFDWVGSINRIADGGEYQRPVPCEQPFYLLMIHADGDVSICCGDSTKNAVVNNIHLAKSVKEILLSDILKSKRIDLLKQNYENMPACKCCGVYSAVDRILFDNRAKLLKILNK
jgi:MoaA/NifB/PqqE/SkfB family radical SAM enzyme